MPAGAFTTIMARLRRNLGPIVASDPGFLLEDKRYALALHYRQAQPETSERGVARFLAAVLEFQRKGVALEVLHGKKVVEVRPVGVSKGKAIQYLLRHQGNTTLPFYLGDDATDEDAFRIVNGRGLTVLVTDSPQRTAARYYLRSPQEVFDFLSHLLSLRQSTKTAN
jgi:trehalose-phosphatase